MGQGTEREGKAGKPRRTVVSLSALERLARIDNKRARQHHLGETKGGTEKETLGNDSPNVNHGDVVVVQIVDGGNEHSHEQNCTDADSIASETLYEIGAERAKGEQAEGKGCHRQASIEWREMLVAHQPLGHDGNEGINTHRDK